MPASIGFHGILKPELQHIHSSSIKMKKSLPGSNLCVSRSRATPADINEYSNGECHVLALAMHRKLGWPLLVMCEEGRPFWQDPQNPGRAVPVVRHVYALSPDGLAWDIRGSMRQEDIPEDMQENFGVRSAAVLVEKEAGMALYVDGMGKRYQGWQRPLMAFTKEDIDLSWGVAIDLLSGLPGFGSAQTLSTRGQRRTTRNR